MKFSDYFSLDNFKKMIEHNNIEKEKLMMIGDEKKTTPG